MYIDNFPKTILKKIEFKKVFRVKYFVYILYDITLK